MQQKSLFTKFIKHPRVLDFLLTERDLDFSITDLAKNSKIGRATLYRLWDDLIKNKIIIHTRDIGKAKLYKFNTENSKIQKLIELDDMLNLEDLKQRTQITIPQKIKPNK